MCVTVTANFFPVVMAKMPVQIRPSLRKKQKSKRERMESTDPEKDVWRKQWNEGKERQRWNRSSKASGMRVSEQGMWKKRCKVVIGKQDVGE